MPTDPHVETPKDGPSGVVAAVIAKRDESIHLGMVVPGENGHAHAEDGMCPEPAKAVQATTIIWPLGGSPKTERSVEIAAAASRRSDFGKYELIEEIGRGGMGVVYRARQVDLDRIVAVKMILANQLASVEQVERFYAEARAAAKVRSPHTVAIHEVGQIHGQHYFAMEYIAGPSLAKRLEGGPLHPDQAARIVLTVARGVGELHRQGIVHRDLKPSNVLLDEAGEPHVSDFGLAKMLSAEGGATGTGFIVGTPSYMAPEQAAGQGGEIGPLTDVYALGALLYEALTGRPPFREASPLDTLVQVIEGEPQRPSRLRPGLPTALEAIVLKAMSKEPAGRYASADDLADDLERHLKGEQVDARRRSPWQRVRGWARREPALLCRLGTMALCGLIVGVDFAVLSRDHYRRDALTETIALVLTWAATSLGCRAALRRERWGDAPRFAWAMADVVLFTALVQVNRGLSTSLVAGYFLLVTTSGLWFRDLLVLFTTGLAVVGYGALVLIEAIQTREPPELPYTHFVFATALAVTGLVSAYQVKRVRALSHYYEHRPLP